MALPPTNTAQGDAAKGDEAFLREVDDAVRASDLQRFLKRWGIVVGGAILLALVAFGGWIIWSNNREAAAGRTGEQFVTAIDALNAGRARDADAQFARLAASGGEGYRAPALLMQANIAQAQGNAKKASDLYARVQADTAVAQPWRDLALLRGTAVQFDRLKPQEVVDRLKPLAEPGGPWFGSAGEMTAIAYMKMKREDLAGPIFAAIAKDDKVPPSLRGRARQMAGLLGIDAVQPDVTNAGATGKPVPAPGEGSNR